MFVQIDFTDTTEQVEEILSALWVAIGSPNKGFLKHLAFVIGEVTAASTVEERDEFLEILSRNLRHPETFEQSSDATRFLSMVRKGSTSTIDEVKAQLATALTVLLTVVAEDDAHAQEQGSEDMPIDNLVGQDSDVDPMSISDSPSDASSSDKSGMSDGTETLTDAMPDEPVL